MRRRVVGGFPRTSFLSWGRGDPGGRERVEAPEILPTDATVRWTSGEVDPPRMPGMTATDTPDRAPTALPKTVLEHRQSRVFRAGRRKPTGPWQKWRKPPLVKSWKLRDESPHDPSLAVDPFDACRPAGRRREPSFNEICVKRSSNSFFKLVKSERAASGRRWTTRSRPWRELRPEKRRKISRTRRLIRCRTTALPTLRLAVIPRRAEATSLRWICKLAREP